MDWKIFARTSLTKIWCAVLNCLCSVDKYFYNIASRAAESNSVYVSVLKIPIVLADGVSKCMASPILFFARVALVRAGKKLYFATIMDTENQLTRRKTKTILRPFLMA